MEYVCVGDVDSLMFLCHELCTRERAEIAICLALGLVGVQLHRAQNLNYPLFFYL